MIIGLILVGGGIGAISALAALILGHSAWMALLIYSATGALVMLAGAVMVALRTPSEDCPAPAKPPLLAHPQRG